MIPTRPSPNAAIFTPADLLTQLQIALHFPMSCVETRIFYRKESGMNGLRMGAIFLGTMAMLAGGCQNKLHDDNMALHDQNRKLQADLNDTRDSLGDSETRLAKAPDPS